MHDYEWLSSDAAEPWLTRAEQIERDAGVAAALALLRKDLAAERARLVAEQVELRRRAAVKFSQAERMFFTRKGLEQATDEPIARYKAQRFGSAGTVDLCCGIGGDLIALAERGAAAGVDLDPLAAHFAMENVRRVTGKSVAVHVQDAAAEPAAPFSAWHIDPDRRATGGRTTKVEAFEPPLAVIGKRLDDCDAGAVKLAPATEVPAAWRAACEREWIGSRRECRQQVAWFGPLAGQPGLRTASVVHESGARTVVESPGATLHLADEPRKYLYEPHAAVLAAQLAPTIATEHALSALTPEGGYLTGDVPWVDAALATFAVQDVLPFDRKRLKAYFRERQIGRLEIKKRGVGDDPEALRKQLDLRGECEAVLLLYRARSGVVAVIAQRTTLS